MYLVQASHTPPPDKQDFSCFLYEKMAIIVFTFSKRSV